MELLQGYMWKVTWIVRLRVVPTVAVVADEVLEAYPSG
jgi:hypothetical protein